MLYKTISQFDAPQKVTGESIYTEDMKLPHLLTGRILRSPHPHAKVLNIDIRKAIRMPGVKAVITGEDVPPFLWGPNIDDEFILARGKVRFIGDEVAAVAAIDEETALEALSLIKVEYELLEGVFDPEAALRPEAPPIHDKGNVAVTYNFSRGNIDDGFAQSSTVLEGVFEVPRAHQAYLQPHCVLAQVDSQGRIDFWAPSQTPFLLRTRMAKALGVPEEQIRIRQTVVGGGFGGKNMVPSLYMIAILLAKKTGKPVRIQNTREEEFYSGRVRCPAKIWLKMGIGADGTILAKDANIIMDCGAYASNGPTIMTTTSMRMDNLYKIRNLRTKAHLVYTNQVSVGSFRGFGNPQIAFALESMIDMLATAIGKDSLEVRLKNATLEGDTTVHGWEILSCLFKETLERAAEESGWKEKKKRKVPYRGIGMASVIHVSGNRIRDDDTSSAFLRISPTGVLHLLTGEGDIGQGAYSTFQNIVARELEVPLDRVQVSPVDTHLSPLGFGAFASRVTIIGGNAVLDAARDLKKQILQAASRIYNVSIEHLAYRGGKVAFLKEPGKEISLEEVAHRAMALPEGPPLLGRGFYNPPTVKMNPNTKFGNVAPAYSFGTHVAEVEVDRQTGAVRILGYWAVHDSGKIINPIGAEGQVEGGIIQGLGSTLTEEMIISDGKPLNPSFRDYSLLTALDIPPLKIIFLDSEDPRGPHGAKGLGEPVLVPCAPAVANAIFDAIGIRFQKIPILPEKVFFSLQKKNENDRIENIKKSQAAG